MRLNKRIAFSIVFPLLFSVYSINAQLTVTGGISNTTFSQYLFGSGVKISNLTINCSGLNQYGTFNATLTNLGIDSGLLISTGTIQEAIGPNNNCCSSVTVGTNSTDPCVNTILGSTQQQYDPCIVEFDIVPSCDTFNVSYVFGSEEYNTGIGGYNDVFGFFVSGPNPGGGSYTCQDFALIPGTNTPVTINNVNYKTNTAYYRDNHNNTSNLYNDFQPNGLTVPLTAVIPVVACQSYHMKVVVVDIANPLYDSWVFLKFQSLACAKDQLLSVNHSDTSICIGQTVPLVASGGANYNWAPGAGLSATIGASVIADPLVTITYTVSATIAGTCTSTDSVIINVGNPPVAKFSADTNAGCYPLCVTFKDLSTSTTAITSWVWDFGDGDTTGSHNTSPKHCYTKPGNYTVILTVTTGVCTDDITVPNMISVYDYPRASFTVSPVTTNIFNATINFTNTSTDLYGITNLQWMFGDGHDTITIQDPHHTYADTGEFCSNLIVTNKYGCSDTTMRCVEIEPLYTMYIPDAFTPNSDGVDDYFAPKGEGFKTFEMWIFDRWGMLLFHSNSINQGWDGKVHTSGAAGKVCEEDTYIYIIQVTDDLNNPRNYMGKVSLVK